MRSAKITTVKPSETIGTIGGSSDGIHPYHLGQFFRRIKILGPVPQHLRLQALGMDDFDFFEDSKKKKVKPTYRSIDSEWEPTKKYEL
jgi:hypothetical protein